MEKILKIQLQVIDGEICAIVCSALDEKNLIALKQISQRELRLQQSSTLSGLRNESLVTDGHWPVW
jgi:hypothetical protein